MKDPIPGMSIDKNSVEGNIATFVLRVLIRKKMI
jgi:hypothetical protein